ncbi:YhcB family protein [Marinobacter sp. M3C]|jgi:hypothetical protein|uniref:YhcB family protein n=1 Tax=unclassified Marinobacter TaxID=83889 RepID=UPI00200EF905|nr:MULTISPECIES: DUF1043 family protein [unclassified Marinobacter]MCL1479520.1 YhcB family protein [Marinobacter sp.]MCL1482193.1 YhcB family protein [Marinobacter sp.]MCL1485514.1 YhcB family protein [Marinobacter sp.]MCL1488493.1 YhcB family protein [Marinobacter sp.]UQG54657.1 YhcB family protein [Marinobacter sp. M4C]
MTNLIMAAVAALVVGILIGVLLGRSTGQGSSLRQRRTEQQVDELRNEYTRYQAQVNEHFMESAHLLRRFNDSYRDVNQHMAKSATRLCNDDELIHELEQNSAQRLKDERKEGSEPPRDYAPKDPDGSGTLAEDYGLKEKAKARAKAKA